jgi:hypothetical protein
MYWLIVVPPVALLMGWAYRRRGGLRDWGREVQIARAHELFNLQHERLEELFFKAAAATGKPRGLRWVRCTFEPGLILARRRQGRQLLGLASVTIQFEAIPGSDMEGLPAVGNLRNASAVFEFVRGHWQTSGRAVFNLNPPEVLTHFKNDYEPAEAIDERETINDEPKNSK